VKYPLPQRRVSESHDKFLHFYDPSWGRLKAITYPAVGNHACRSPGRRSPTRARRPAT